VKLLGLSLFCTLLTYSAMATAEWLEVNLVIKDHLFNPSHLTLPAQTKIKLVIHNQDDSPEEFESFSLNREKVILAQAKSVVFLGPLEPGEHLFIGEYNPDSARGIIRVIPYQQWQAETPHVN